MLDVESGEIIADLDHHQVDRPLAHQRKPLAFGLPQQSATVFGDEYCAHRLQVIARIKPSGNLADVFAKHLAVAQIGRTREHVDLGASIVDVILACNLETSPGEK